MRSVVGRGDGADQDDAPIPSQGAPAIGADGTIYVGSDGGKLYALTPAGALKWEFTVGGNIISSPTISAEGVIYFGSVDRYLYAVNLYTKSLVNGPPLTTLPR